MRFELFLTKLPRAAPARIKSTVAELPKGVSTGVLLKTLETHQVPTVPVAWHEDKRVVNEIMDALVDLGAECRLVDHGNVLLRLGTFVAERMGRDRYREDEEDEPDPSLFERGNDDAPSLAEELTRHTLIYLLQSGVVAGLFVWLVGLRVGLTGMNASRQLLGQVLCCTIGTLAAHVACSSIQALRAGRMPRKLTLSLCAACALPTLVAPFFVGSGFAPQAELARVKRPPSYPYAGLLTELQRRKLADELAGSMRDHDEIDGDELRDPRSLADARRQAEAALSCLIPDADLTECAAGPYWEDALACLPAPIQVPRPRAALDATVAAATDTSQTGAPAAARPSAPRPVKQELTVTFALIDVLSLLAICLLISLGLFVYEKRQGKPAPGARELEDAAGTANNAAKLSAAHKAHADALASAQEQHRSELAAVRAQLEQATNALANTRAATPVAARSEDSQLIRMTQELGLTRGALGASQGTIHEMREKLSALGESQRKLEQESAQRSAELTRATERYAKAEAELRELRPLRERHAPANDAVAIAAPNTGVGPKPTEPGAGRGQTAGDSSSYSVTSGQEERIVLPKRRR
jgi:flagellar biosynthesis chaperone FliJ